MILKRLAFSTSRILLSLMAFGADESGSDITVPDISPMDGSPCCDCRSNATHIVWKNHEYNVNLVKANTAEIIESVLRRADTSSNQNCQCLIQTRKQAENDCLSFLKENIMGFDKSFLETLGFPVDDDDTADGLDYGLIQPTIRLSLDAKIQYNYTDDLPKSIFLDYVLNYVNLNEARTNWRPLLVDALQFNASDLHLSGKANISSVTTWVNTHLWTKLARNPDQPIYFKSSQTPLIFDPMSIIAFGYASCTGMSILFCNALRAVGIPARVAGTPAWYGNRSKGNHNWVEVYVGNGEWKFLEPSPALSHVDTLEDDPCNRWFCDSTRYPSSKVYAAKMSQNDTYFPIAWEWDCHDVPAVDRTDYYTKICGGCHNHDDVDNSNAQ